MLEKRPNMHACIDAGKLGRMLPKRPVVDDGCYWLHF